MDYFSFYVAKKISQEYQDKKLSIKGNKQTIAEIIPLPVNNEGHFEVFATHYLIALDNNNEREYIENSGQKHKNFIPVVRFTDNSFWPLCDIYHQQGLLEEILQRIEFYKQEE